MVTVAGTPAAICPPICRPLTPMTDSNLVQVLQRQTQHRVGLAGHADVAAGVDGLRARFDALRAEGAAMAIVDAITDTDLMTIGAAAPMVIKSVSVMASTIAIAAPSARRASKRARNPSTPAATSAWPARPTRCWVCR